VISVSDAEIIAELNAQWYDHEAYWDGTFDQLTEVEALIEEFNDRVGINQEAGV
jgi:cysteine synthase A